MGIRLNGIETGANCACHPLPTSTPKKIYILFNGIEQCPGKPQAPNGVTFVCHQDSLDSCLWFSEPNANGFVAAMRFLCFAGDVSIVLSIPGSGFFFSQLKNVPITEYEVFDNSFVACFGAQFGFNGSAVAFWLDAISQLIIDLVLPTDGDGLFLETFFVSDTQIVHRFANVTYALNQKVLFSI